MTSSFLRRRRVFSPFVRLWNRRNMGTSPSPGRRITEHARDRYVRWHRHTRVSTFRDGCEEHEMDETFETVSRSEYDLRSNEKM